jgi:hypothetical protein
MEFCYKKTTQLGAIVDIEDITHETNCAYNIAKGLSTNIII